MAKGIIVTTMPASCGECACWIGAGESDKGNICCLTEAGVKEYVAKETKPDWCPIKPLPEKMDYQTRHGLLQEQIMVGWNMCIDEILGEEMQDDNT